MPDNLNLKSSREQMAMETIGNCCAYSLRSGDLLSFDVDGVGSMAYHRTRSGFVYAVGDPLSLRGDEATIIHAFRRRFPEAAFIQCSDLTARHLSNAGYYINNYGFETELELGSWSCQGRRSHMLRKQRKKSERAGISIREITSDQAALRQAQQISDRWLAEKKATSVELKMLTRPPVFACEPGTRKFAAYGDDTMLGIAFFDPLSLSDANQGYVFQIVRTASHLTGTGTHLLLHAADLFHQESKQIMSLGNSPLARRPESRWRHSRATKYILRAFKWSSRNIYDYTGLEFYKTRFGGTEKPVYFCSRHILPARALIGLATETGMAQLVARSLLETLTRGPLRRRRQPASPRRT